MRIYNNNNNNNNTRFLKKKETNQHNTSSKKQERWRRERSPQQRAIASGPEKPTTRSQDIGHRQTWTVNRSFAFIRRTIVPDGRELIRWGISSQPLLHGEPLRCALLVHPGGGHLHVITVPPMARARPVGGEVHCTNRPMQTRASPTENVQIAPLEVVVSWAH